MLELTLQTDLYRKEGRVHAWWRCGNDLKMPVAPQISRLVLIIINFHVDHKSFIPFAGDWKAFKPNLEPSFVQERPRSIFPMNSISAWSIFHSGWFKYLIIVVFFFTQGRNSYSWEGNGHEWFIQLIWYAGCKEAPWRLSLKIHPR